MSANANHVHVEVENVAQNGAEKVAQNSVDKVTLNGVCPASYALTMDTLNPNIIRLEYAVRGPIVHQAHLLEERLRNGEKLPFDEVIRCNIGDVHAMGQRPITFIRQMVVACTVPELMHTYPSDVQMRAARILEECRGHSQGNDSIRKDIAAWLERRDGHPSTWDDVFIGSGASECIKVRVSALRAYPQ
jgi:alanine transaminase